MVKTDKIFVMTSNDVELVKLTEQVKEIVSNSGVRNGIVAVITAHTTTGITVNEGLDCLETDIVGTLRRLVPDDLPYTHAHFLPTYGRTSANATGHLRGMLLGNNCIFPIENGKVLLGEAQDVYLAELDGPQKRKLFVNIIGE